MKHKVYHLCIFRFNHRLAAQLYLNFIAAEMVSNQMALLRDAGHDPPRVQRHLLRLRGARLQEPLHTGARAQHLDNRGLLF